MTYYPTILHNHITQFHITVKYLLSPLIHTSGLIIRFLDSPTLHFTLFGDIIHVENGKISRKYTRQQKNSQNVCLLKPPTRQKNFHHVIHIHDDTLHVLHFITHVTSYVIRVMCRHECV